MTETPNTPTSFTDAKPLADAERGDPTPIHPADVLLNLIVQLLAPMFLDASGGNIAFARMAALETVNAYRIRHNADLIAVAQIIAFGLAALGSLSLSMADDISLSMTLRLRGNANALNRSAEQNRRSLGKTPSGVACHQTEYTAAAEPPDAQYEQQVVATVAALQASTASAPQLATPPPAAVSEQQRQAMWAAAMTKVAAEVTASLPGLPPQQRRAASMRAAALSSTATDLLCGNVPPRLRPGALDGLIPSRAA